MEFWKAAGTIITAQGAGFVFSTRTQADCAPSWPVHNQVLRWDWRQWFLAFDASMVCQKCKRPLSRPLKSIQTSISGRFGLIVPAIFAKALRSAAISAFCFQILHALSEDDLIISHFCFMQRMFLIFGGFFDQKPSFGRLADSASKLKDFSAEFSYVFCTEGSKNTAVF